MSHIRCAIEQLPQAARVANTVEFPINPITKPDMESLLMQVCEDCLLKRVCFPEFNNLEDKAVVTRYRQDI